MDKPRGIPLGSRSLGWWNDHKPVDWSLKLPCTKVELLAIARAEIQRYTFAPGFDFLRAEMWRSIERKVTSKAFPPAPLLEILTDQELRWIRIVVAQTKKAGIQKDPG